MEHENPYQSPGATPPDEPLSDERVLYAAFQVDRALLARVERFLTEKHLQTVNIGLVLSLVLLLGLLLGMIFPLPRRWWFAVLVLFFIQQAVLVGWQSWHVRRRVRRWERERSWPAPLGAYQLEVTLDRIKLDAELQHHEWPFTAVANAYYLGDVLLIVTEPGTLIPIPRTADFGADDFASFCRTFAMRYKVESGK